MNGHFIPKKNLSIVIMLLLIGVFIIGVAFFSQTPWSFFLMGTLICLSALPFLTMNRGAYLRIDEHGIQGKYHWFGKINCKLSDIDFVLPQINTITIKLKNGKVHTIGGISNSFEMSAFLRRNTPFEAAKNPNELIQELNQAKKKQKKNYIWVGILMAWMFIAVFITVFLTGEREMYEFNQTDWEIFSIMVVVEVVTIVYLFYFAIKTGKARLPMEKLRYTVMRSIVETHPLTPGFHVAVYSNIFYNTRITVFGHPHRDDVYFCVDSIDENFQFSHSYASESFENFEELSKQFDGWIDITDIVLKTKTEE